MDYYEDAVEAIVAWGLQLELLLTASTLSLAIVGVIAGLFGMNLHIPAEVQNSYLDFVLVRSPCYTACLAAA